MPDLPWSDLAVVAALRRQRARKPRRTGLTMVLDAGLGLAETRDILELSGDHIDHWKLSFGTSVFVPPAVLRRKLGLINERGILTFPGGTLFEAAIIQQRCRVYMRSARSLGFRAVEISDGTIDLPAFRRKRAVECAREADLIVICEVGKKDRTRQPEPRQLARQALDDLRFGAAWVVVEGRESGEGVGVFDDTGGVDMRAVDTIAGEMGKKVDRLVWEAPRKAQQTVLVERFGINVSIGNVEPRRVLAVEALRSGLRFETLQPIARALERTGAWNPEKVEPNG